MKKMIIALFIIISTAHALESKSNSDVDISIGVKMWYAMWDPPWADGKTLQAPLSFNPEIWYPFKLNIRPYRIDPTFQVGPQLSISFLHKWSVSSVFTVGKYFALSEGSVLDVNIYMLSPSLWPINPPIFFPESYYRKEIVKYDSDTAVGYNIHEYVKLFLGFKFQGYRYKERIFYYNIFAYKAEAESHFRNMGPALGIGITIPIYRSLYVIYNISGAWLAGKESYQFRYQYTVDTTGDLIPIIARYGAIKFYSYAGNTSLSFAYHFSGSGLTLSAGFRYQVLYYRQDKKFIDFIDYDGKYDHFYGGTLSFVYSFTVGGKTNKKSWKKK